MARDALNSTHPIEAKVRSPEEIEELFDEISYGKGASILRMIEAYIGPDKFQKGVSSICNNSDTLTPRAATYGTIFSKHQVSTLVTSWESGSAR